ncbi:phosphatase PAP2 family protein [Mesorhizobium dulcispinae]|uniref:phosphatase PAP2 family protein n=1 Tax=Mesorhizobium dulcispinae TaxID=3072316 RepID=UPI002A24E47C|nr:phosphatase PAP2 family protein [Mesorhizobium sp. VK23D]MDX8522012.1 phosphatase PAP2 family protein [Mesorhizobium sp. VK23D]
MSIARLAVRSSSEAWRANQPFFVAVTAYVLIALIAAANWKIVIDVKLYNKNFLFFGSAVTLILVVLVFGRLIIERPRQPLRALKDLMLANNLPDRIVVGLPVALVLPIFFSMFTSMKGGISKIQSFYADAALIAIDRAIHGGVDAWRFFHPMLGFGPVTFSLNVLYNLWFAEVFIVLFCAVFSTGNQRLRSQFLVAFVLAWVLLGNVLAAAFASVGPAFVMPFYGDGTFSPLMDYLKATDTTYRVSALYTQGYLLTNAGLDGPRLGSGISAFPSVHVATATLNAIYLWRFGRVLRWGSIAFLVAIQLGSVHLGWHYAVDGYVSILATSAIWAVAGWLSKNCPRPEA